MELALFVTLAALLAGVALVLLSFGAAAAFALAHLATGVRQDVSRADLPAGGMA